VYKIDSTSRLYHE